MTEVITQINEVEQILDLAADNAELHTFLIERYYTCIVVNSEICGLDIEIRISDNTDKNKIRKEKEIRKNIGLYSIILQPNFVNCFCEYFTEAISHGMEIHNLGNQVIEVMENAVELGKVGANMRKLYEIKENIEIDIEKFFKLQMNFVW